MSTIRRTLRNAYLAAGATSVVAAAAGRRGDRLTRLVKPTLMPLLAASAAADGERASTRWCWRGSPAGGSAMSFSWVRRDAATIPPSGPRT